MATSDSEMNGYQTDDTGSLTEVDDDTTREDECWTIRREMQCVLQNEDLITEHAAMISRQLDKLDQIASPKARIIRRTRICKVLKDILKSDKIPRVNELQIKKRASNLHQKLLKILHDEGLDSFHDFIMSMENPVKDRHISENAMESMNAASSLTLLLAGSKRVVLDPVDEQNGHTQLLKRPQQRHWNSLRRSKRISRKNPRRSKRVAEEKRKHVRKM